MNNNTQQSTTQPSTQKPSSRDKPNAKQGNNDANPTTQNGITTSNNPKTLHGNCESEMELQR